MHLVGFCFDPVEKAFYTIPASGLPEFFQVFGGAGSTISIVDPFTGCLVEVFPSGVEVDAAFAAVADEVALALLTAVALERLDGSLFDTEGGIGDGFIKIDPDDSAEAAALRAGSERGVKGKKGGGGGAEGEAGFGIGPGGAEGAGVGGVRDGCMAFSQKEGGFQCLKES